MELELKDIEGVVMPAIKEHRVAIDAAIAEMKASGGATDEKVANIAQQIKELNILIDDLPRQMNESGEKSLGQRFIESDNFKEFKSRGWHRGGATLTVGGSFFPVSTKTTITSTTVGSSTPGILVPQREPGIVKPGVRRVRVRDLMRRSPTTQNAVEFVKENVFTNAASPVNETSAKPESALTFTIDHEPVVTLAHWIPASRQILDDFGALQSYIDGRLIEGLKTVEDVQLLTGDGTGSNISGLITEATAYDTGLNGAGDTKIDKLRHAIRQVEVADLECDGIVVNPADWEEIELVKDQASNVGNYVLGNGPRGTSEPFLWGKAVAVTTAMPYGTFLVGSFQLACEVWDRMEARIDVSTEHSTYFTQNMVAIRAEERLALTVYRAASFIYGSF